MIFIYILAILLVLLVFILTFSKLNRREEKHKQEILSANHSQVVPVSAEPKQTTIVEMSDEKIEEHFEDFHLEEEKKEPQKPIKVNPFMARPNPFEFKDDFEDDDDEDIDLSKYQELLEKEKRLFRSDSDNFFKKASPEKPMPEDFKKVLLDKNTNAFDEED